MKIFILLFFIFIILIITSKIELCIDKLIVENRKIKFAIKLNFYILKNIKVFSKKIKKKDIIKIINLSEKKKFLKLEENITDYLDINIDKIDLKIKYGIKHIFINIYLYGLINAVVTTLIARYINEQTKRNINIETDFNNNFIYLNIKLKINIDILNSIINYLKKDSAIS